MPSRAFIDSDVMLDDFGAKHEFLVLMPSRAFIDSDGITDDLAHPFAGES